MKDTRHKSPIRILSQLRPFILRMNPSITLYSTRMRIFIIAVIVVFLTSSIPFTSSFSPSISIISHESPSRGDGWRKAVISGAGYLPWMRVIKKKTWSIYSLPMRTNSRLTTAASLLHDYEPINGLVKSSNQQQQQQPPRRPELWLDLRGTAIRPQEALDFIQEFVLEEFMTNNNVININGSGDSDTEEANEYSETIETLVDRILVSSDIFDQVLDADAKEMDLVYVVTKNDDKQQQQLLMESRQLLMESRHETQQSFPLGEILQSSSSSSSSPEASSRRHAASSSSQLLLNPMEALDIYSRGEIVFVDSNDQIADATDDKNAALSSWLNQVEGLVQFLSSLSIQPAVDEDSNIINTSGLLMIGGQTDKNKNSSPSPSSAAGIAISCPNKQVFVRMDAMIMSLSFSSDDDTASSSTMTTTDSGILIPNAAVEQRFLVVEDFSSSATSMAGTTAAAATPPAGAKATMAFVLPLDVNLWKTVLDVRRTTAVGE